MNNNLKEYLEGLIVDHGVTDLDSLGEHELGKLSELVSVEEDLMNDDEFTDLMIATDFFVGEDKNFIRGVAKISTRLIIAQIGELFDELLVANRPEDNSHEDAPRTAENDHTFEILAGN